MNVATNTLLIN